MPKNGQWYRKHMDNNGFLFWYRENHNYGTLKERFDAYCKAKGL